jgi:hypothetical protein
MTAVKTLAGESLLIQIGDGATPTETFTHDCLINTDRGISFSSDVTDVIVPDCDDPEAPAFKQRFIDGLSGDVSGAGILHTASVETWFNWFVSGDSKNVRVNQNVAGALGGGYFAAAYKLASFSISGARKNLSTCEVSLVSTGAVTWVDNA